MVRFAAWIPLGGDPKIFKAKQDVYENGRFKGYWFHAYLNNKDLIPTSYTTVNGVEVCTSGWGDFKRSATLRLGFRALGSRMVSYGLTENVSKGYTSVTISISELNSFELTSKPNFKYEVWESHGYVSKRVDGYTVDELYAVIDTLIDSVEMGNSIPSYYTEKMIAPYLGDIPGIPEVHPYHPRSFSYKYNELSRWGMIGQLGFVPSGLMAGLGAAYLDATSNIPEAQANTITNLLDSISIIKNLVVAVSTGSVKPLLGDITKISPQDFWLKYRYVYNTNKSDIEDFVSLSERLSDLSHAVGEQITLHGTYSRDEELFRCAVTFELQDLMPKNLADKLRAIGFRLNLTNIWDIIPFSFMVDWVTGIGDYLSHFDSMYEALQYKPVSIWYSYETSYDGQGVYMRFTGQPFVTSATLVTHESSNKTWLMRVADTLSIFGH